MLLWINCKWGLAVCTWHLPTVGSHQGFLHVHALQSLFTDIAGQQDGAGLPVTAGWSQEGQNPCAPHTVLRVITMEHLPHYTHPAWVLGRAGGAFYYNLASVPDSAAEFFHSLEKTRLPSLPKVPLDLQTDIFPDCTNR